MRNYTLLLFVTLFGTLNAQTFQWNKPANTQARSTQTATVQDPLFDETGEAVYYADYFEGSPTALGETYHHHLMTAAHAKLPLGTIVKVTRLDNGLVTTVRINDRGAYCDNCVIDLSRAAAQQIDLIRVGRARVALTVLGFSNTNPPTPNGYDPPAVSANLTARRPEASQTYEISSGNPYNHQAAVSGMTAKSGDANAGMNGRALREYQVQYTPEDYSNTIPVREPQQYAARGTTTARTPAAATTQPAVTTRGQVNILNQRLTGYAIQLGSYSKMANAERHVMALQEKGFNSLFVMPQQKADGTSINRVIVAPFQSIRQAEDYLADLRQYQQMEGLIISMQ